MKVFQKFHLINLQFLITLLWSGVDVLMTNLALTAFIAVKMVLQDMMQI